MAKAILVVATHPGIGLTSTVLGLYHALDRKGVKVGFHKPVMQYDVESQDVDHSRAVLLHSSRAVGDDALVIRPEAVQQALDADNLDELMETVIQNFEAAKGDAEKDADEDGQHERLAACLLADDGEDKGNRECRRHRKGKA